MTTAATKRAWKLQEYVAHGSNVNCLALGHKTGRVMVTGGEDRKVNLWTVGKSNCVMSLSGHTSPVEAVRFGNAEELVVAGSMSGALKIWDLEQAKIIRTLTGHKANIRCLDFHPYGDFVASGSLDTNLKLWDIRRKGCIFTYKGHSNGVNSIRFSPDGRWIASAGEDSVIKIWDLAAGKLLADLKHHTAAVNCLEFHPNEYLLASGSSDRSIKFWELERFQCVDSTDFDNNAVRSVLFHPDGACIFGGSTDLVKVYGWEPSKCFDSVNMGWGKVVDMAIAQTQLIGVSINQTNVSTFVLDLTRVAPVGVVPSNSTPPMSSSGRKNFNHERPSTTSTKQQSVAQTHNTIDNHQHRQVASPGFRSSYPLTGSGSSPVSPDGSIKDSRSSSPAYSTRSSSPSTVKNRRSQSRNSDSNSYTFKQTRSSALRRSHSLMNTITLNNNNNEQNFNRNSSPQPSKRGHSKTVSRSASQSQSPRHSKHKPLKVNPIDVTADSNMTPLNESATIRHISRIRQRQQRDVPVTILTSPKPREEPEDTTPGADENDDETNSTADVKDPTEYEEVFKPKGRLGSSPPKKIDPFPAPQEDDVSKLAAEFKSAAPFHDGKQSVIPPSRQGGGDTYRAPAKQQQKPFHPPASHYQSAHPSSDRGNPLAGMVPAGIDPRDFMPAQTPFQTNVPQLSDYEACSQISKGHSSMSALLSARNKNLQIVRAMWSSGNVRTALESAIQMKDDSVIVDILNVLNDKPYDWSLDVLELLLRPIYKILHSKFEAHVVVSCASLKLILKNYSKLIRDNLATPDKLGVDISAEERHRKCLNIYRVIQDIRLSIEGKHNQAGKLAGTFKEIQLLLNHLDT